MWQNSHILGGPQQIQFRMYEEMKSYKFRVGLRIRLIIFYLTNIEAEVYI